MKPSQLPPRWAAKIRIDANGCWLWTAAKYKHSGYGVAPYDSNTRVAHRAVYAMLVGEVPAGLQLDHLCRVRACVNPAHLEPVTQRINLLRGETIPAAHSVKTHCPKGHEYTPENTRTYKGSRFCKQCHRDREVARYHREDGAAIRKQNRLAQRARLGTTVLHAPGKDGRTLCGTPLANAALGDVATCKKCLRHQKKPS